MSRFFLEVATQRDLDHLLEAKEAGMHKTLSGRFVRMGTKACERDIAKRIDDLKHHRDESASGTDSRMIYTGLLRILRKKYRANEKLMMSEKEKKNSPRSLVEESVDDVCGVRVLNLAGIL